MPHGDADWISWQYPERLRPGLVHDSPQSCPVKRTIFRDKILNDQNKMKRPVAPTNSSIKLILYFSWCSFQHFKKLRHVPAALPTREKAAERSLKRAQRLMIITQFLVKLWRTIFSWDHVTWFCLSSREREGGNIQIRVSLNTSTRDVLSAWVLWIRFLGYFMTLSSYIYQPTQVFFTHSIFEWNFQFRITVVWPVHRLVHRCILRHISNMKF